MATSLNARDPPDFLVATVTRILMSPMLVLLIQIHRPMKLMCRWLSAMMVSNTKSSIPMVTRCFLQRPLHHISHMSFRNYILKSIMKSGQKSRMRTGDNFWICLSPR